MIGIGIPYYKNSEECEIAFKKLMKTIDRQVTNDTLVYIYEDGQVSDWLRRYLPDGVTKVKSNPINNGVSYARNEILNYFIGKVDYILFIDSDDMIDCDFITKMLEIAKQNIYDLIISDFIYNKRKMLYPRRYNVAGVCIKMNTIGKLKFDENYNISEDTLFIDKIYEKDIKCFKINSNYYYNYGVNNNSLMKRYERSEIGIRRNK